MTALRRILAGYREHSRLTPRKTLPDMLQQVLDNHEAVYWTVFFCGIGAGFLLTLGLLSYLGRI